MLIRHIIYDSLKLPFKEYKLFILVVILACFCEFISDRFYSLKLGQWSVLLMILNSVITIIILGVMMNLAYNALFDIKIELDPKSHFLEGVKEYFISLFYIILTVIFTSFFIVPTGVYQRLIHINEYIINNDIDTTFLTLHQLSQEVPVDLTINLHHSLQLNFIIAIFIFLLFSSFGFIGKILYFKSDDLKTAFNLKKIFGVVKDIGYRRYSRFLFAIFVVVIIVFNLIVGLEFMFNDSIISGIIEAFVLFFSTNAFYLIYLERDV